MFNDLLLLLYIFLVFLRIRFSFWAEGLIPSFVIFFALF